MTARHAICVAACPSSCSCTGLFFNQSIHDRGLGRGLLAPVEDVVEAARADPDDLAVAPELLAEHAHALLDALLDGVRLHGRLALRGEDRPVRLFAVLGLAISDQVLWHRISLLSATGVSRSVSPFHHLDETVEEVVRVLRTG